LSLRTHRHDGDHQSDNNQLRIHEGLPELEQRHDAIWHRRIPEKFLHKIAANDRYHFPRAGPN
jgi:hypothetical protein